jgi:hypothetical protein
MPRGMARREGAAFESIRTLLSQGAAPFGAPPGQTSPGLFAAFSLLCRAALSTDRFARALATISRRLLGHRSFAVSDFAWRCVVSELLAGTPNGPGRSPVTARVRGYEPRPRAPHSRRAFAHPAQDRWPAYLRRHPHPACSISQRPAETPLGEQGMRNMILDYGESMEDIPRRELPLQNPQVIV